MRDMVEALVKTNEDLDLDSQVSDLYLVMMELIKQKIPTAQAEEVEVATSILELTKDVLDKKFKLFNPVTPQVEELLSVYFGVNNSNLLNIFKLIEWLTKPKDNTSAAEIEKHFFEFLNYGNFNLMNLNIEKIKLVLMFLKNFNRADVLGILQFLRDLQLNREYVYIFSRYIWIVTLNKNFKEEKEIDSKLAGSIAILHWYPLIEILKYEIMNNQPTMSQYLAEINEMQNYFLVSIGKLPFEKVFHVVDTNFNTTNQEKFLYFLKGESFKSIPQHQAQKERYISKTTNSDDLRVLLEKISNLFFFSLEFFNESGLAPSKIGQTGILSDVIDFSITIYLEMIETHGQNQAYIEELFENQQQFSKSAIKKKFDGIFKKTNRNPIAIANPNSKQSELKNSDALFSAEKYLRFIKYYVLQIKNTNKGKLEDIKSHYMKIFVYFFSSFLRHAITANELNNGNPRSKKERLTLKVDRAERAREEPDGAPGSRADPRPEAAPRLAKMPKDIEEKFDMYRSMMMKMINLFLGMKFKKNYNAIFQDLLDFLTKFIFRSQEKPDKIQELVKKINVEGFFEVYDNIYENRNIFNRNAENILRLCLNNFNKLSQKNFNKATSLVKICRGNIGDLGELLRDLLIRNDRIAFAMSQILWCDELVKNNLERKRITEHRKVNSRMKNSSNVRFLNELSPADQIVFIENLKNKSSLFTEVIPFFEAYLSDDSSFYSKYDIFKLLKRMGFEMTIHRLNEIVSDATQGRRRMIVATSKSSISTLTREEVKNCLQSVETKIMNTVKEMKSANLKNMLFKGILSSTLAYFTIRIYMVFLRNLWVYGNQYSAFVSCIPILGTPCSPSLHPRHRLLLHRLRRVHD